MPTVFYSVGQSAADLKTGSPTVGSVSGVFTFSVAQIGNIGIGDVIDYDVDNKKAYISGKTSTSVWTATTPTGGTPADVSGKTVNSIKRAYTSASAAEAGASDANHLNTLNLVTATTILKFPCYYDSGADTTRLVISGWTQNSSYYIEFFTPTNTSTECNTRQRHNGSWDSAKYNLALDPAYGQGVIDVLDDYAKLTGLQIHVNVAVGAYRFAITTQGTGGGTVQISHGIYKRTVGTDTGSAIGAYQTSGTTKAWNNIIYDWGESIEGAITVQDAGATLYAYNNTVVDCASGLCQHSGSFIAKSNLLKGCGATTTYIGTFAAGTDYNATDTTDSIGTGSNNRISQTFSFENSGGDDFRLKADDTGAKGFGINLANNSSIAFSDDIQNRLRSVVWDIGASQASVAEVKYSVGQNATDHKTGSPTITIASGVATLSEAQTASNLVAGDRVTYNGTSICYLFSKVNGSLTQWNVITATGGTPGDVSGQTVNSIFHEYTSLSLAEAGAGDANHLNTSNLVTGTFNLTFVCCYDSGSDTAQATFAGWTVNTTYYIKVYTPYQTHIDCNLPQRHTGKWTATAWNLTTTNAECITNNTDCIRFEGLQLYSSGAASYGCEGIFNDCGSGTIDILISHCIIRGTPTVAYDNHYGIDMRDTAGTGTLKIWNNIIYDFRRADGANFYYDLAINQSGTAAAVAIHAHNNTFHNCHIACSSRWTATAAEANFYLKNNISSDIAYTTGGAEWDFQYYNPASNYNNATGASSPTGGGGANDKLSQSVSFKDEANDDFHLAYADTSARASGTNLSADGNLAVVDDVDLIPRPTTYDMGADQFDILKPRNRIENY